MVWEKTEDLSNSLMGSKVLSKVIQNREEKKSPTLNMLMERPLLVIVGKSIK